MKILLENIGFIVWADENDSVFCQNKISGATVKLSEVYGGINIEAINSPSQLNLIGFK